MIKKRQLTSSTLAMEPLGKCLLEIQKVGWGGGWVHGAECSPQLGNMVSVSGA